MENQGKSSLFLGRLRVGRRFARIYNNKEKNRGVIWYKSRPIEKMHILRNFSCKSFGGSEKSRTFASAYEEHLLWGKKERVLWKIYIDREVVQEARVLRYSWVTETNRHSIIN